MRAASVAWLDGYQANGYASLPRSFPANEVESWRREADRLAADARLTAAFKLRSGRSWRPQSAVAERLDPVVDVSPIFARVAEDPRVLGPAGQALGQEPRLLRDKLIFKPPGMAGYGLHQDGAWWQDFPYRRILTVALAIDGADEENGAMEFFAGRHERLLSEPGQLRDMTAAEAERAGLRRGTLVPLAPGDGVVFHALTPHRSSTNRSLRGRRLLYLTYGAASDGDGYGRFYEWYRAFCLSHVPSDRRDSYFFA